eukprot:UN10121
MTSLLLDISFECYFAVLINVPMTTPRLTKSFGDDFSIITHLYSVLLVLISLSMKCSRLETSFEDNLIKRSRPQNIFQDYEIPWSPYD